METIKGIMYLIFVVLVSFVICSTIAFGVIFMTERLDWIIPIIFFGTIILCNALGVFCKRMRRR